MNLASDKCTPELPDTMHLDESTYKNEMIPEAFANFFSNKVSDLILQFIHSDYTTYNVGKFINS